ncbi:MAG: hypothetical protein Q8922_08250 [Bacteroidota bacterium]|nr:hypothetical protein [Bacteroidota bacterium]MDP4233521.1 hypothetical protein [Bacteroidota bacterium]MDP4243398.1 hypothetical protein [Bacteroidota bacterium]MDP4287915.1 hypothetical protein [Bacteroidota bacterium]
MSDAPNMPNKETSRNLAERFGMTREAVEGILGDTHREYVATTPSSAAATEGVQEISPSAPVIAPVLIKPKSNGRFMAAILVVLLIGLGITLTFRKGCFEQRQRGSAERSKSIDTVQNLLSREAEQASTPPVPPTQVAPGQVPPEALATPREEPLSGAQPSSIASKRGARSDQVQASPFTTSSGLEAQERLADLRASGNASARVKRLHRHGVTSYRVYER